MACRSFLLLLFLQQPSTIELVVFGNMQLLIFLHLPPFLANLLLRSSLRWKIFGTKSSSFINVSSSHSFAQDMNTSLTKPNICKAWPHPRQLNCSSFVPEELGPGFIRFRRIAQTAWPQCKHASQPTQLQVLLAQSKFKHAEHMHSLQNPFFVEQILRSQSSTGKVSGNLCFDTFQVRKLPPIPLLEGWFFRIRSLQDLFLLQPKTPVGSDDTSRESRW